jgi:hypothetical protein
MQFEDLFDLLGKHLLAAGVDHLRAAAEQLERTIGLDRRPVARHRPAPALDLPERSRRLLFILVVADRNEAGNGQQAALARARLDAAAVLGEYRRVHAEHELGCLGLGASRGGRGAEAYSLR